MTGFLSYLGQRVAGLLLGGLLALGPAAAEPVIFAAASTRTALEDALEAGAFPATVSYGASGTIARQIVQGAPADVFLSANPKWMRFLVDEGLVAAGTIEVLASNRLVLIGPDDKPPLALDKRAVEARLGGEFFAVADPQVAPVGPIRARGDAPSRPLGKRRPGAAAHPQHHRNCRDRCQRRGRAWPRLPQRCTWR